MGARVAAQRKILCFDADLRESKYPIPTQLIDDVISSFKVRERMTGEAQDANEELLGSLQQANEEIVREEHSPATSRWPAESVLRMVAQTLGRVEEALVLLQGADKRKSVGTCADGANGILAPRQESVQAFQDGLEDPECGGQRTQNEVVKILIEIRDFLLSIAEIPEKNAREQSPPPANSYPSRNVKRFQETTWPGEVYCDAAAVEDLHHDPEDHVGISRNSDNRAGSIDSEEELADAPLPLGECAELVASPFTNLAALHSFYRALQRLPGVVQVKAREFDQGTLTVTISYCGPISLASQLTQISGFNLSIVSIEEERIEAFVLD